MDPKRVRNLLLLTSLRFLSVLGARFTGNSCIIEQQLINGKCRSLGECPLILSEIKQGKEYTRCGFDGKTEIVCCPPDEDKLKPIPLIDSRPKLRISEKKCIEYETILKSFAEESLNIEERFGPSGNCINISTSFNNETLADYGEFPNMFLIVFEGNKTIKSWQCGGTLISDQYILLAAHCTQLSYGQPRYIRFERSPQKDDYDQYIVSTIIVHPNYNRKLFYNDLALIKLKRKLTLTPRRIPACLPTSMEDGNQFGVLTFYKGESVHLHKVAVAISPEKDCESALIFDRSSFSLDTRFCAESKVTIDERSSTMDGSMQTVHPDFNCLYTVIGIGSFGMKATNYSKPIVFTRVYPFVDWIESVAWRET